MGIHAHRKTIELLEGEYSSIHHGRSHDFDDLREYAPGDEVKDIDWKATARSTVPLIKRYIASRQHNIVFIVDTGRGMAAVAESGEPKKEIAIQAVGVPRLPGHASRRSGLDVHRRRRAPSTSLLPAARGAHRAHAARCRREDPAGCARQRHGAPADAGGSQARPQVDRVHRL